jgi:hypothetical protein
MNTNQHLRHYVAEFVSEWEIIHTKFVGNIKFYVQ